MDEPPHISLWDEEEPPPVLGTWRRLYVAIALYLLLVIVLFYLFTVTFNGTR
jgi:hypothetical protein